MWCTDRRFNKINAIHINITSPVACFTIIIPQQQIQTQIHVL